jgi:23S rRNA (pseudouridine1915-N3)-methyltransferase
MKPITIICIGKIKQAQRYLIEGIAEFEKRLKGQLSIQWVEIPEKIASEKLPIETIQKQQADAILHHLKSDSVIVLLDERGDMMDSISFSKWVFGAAPPDGGTGVLTEQPMMFIVGGADGLWPGLKEHSHRMISLSKLTWPHQVVRLLLIEQLYRGWMISHNKPYHK